jgi:hypothetical protein
VGRKILLNTTIDTPRDTSCMCGRERYGGKRYYGGKADKRYGRKKDLAGGRDMAGKDTERYGGKKDTACLKDMAENKIRRA